MLSSLVDRNACHEIAKKLSLGDFILLGQTEKSSRGNNKKVFYLMHVKHCWEQYI